MDELIAARDAGAFKEHCRKELAAAKRRLDEILSASGPRTPGNTLEPYNELSMAVGSLWNIVGLLRSVHPDPAIRSAAEESETEIANFVHDLGLNRALYDTIAGCDTSGLDAVGQRFVAHALRDFHRAGVDRKDAEREKIRTLREELVVLGQEFLRNIVGDVRSIELGGVQEMEGLPEDYIRERAAGTGGKIRITTDHPDYNPFMTYAGSGDRRRELYKEFRRRAYPANQRVLKKLIEKRHELTQLLGYPSWAAYITEDKMIQRPGAVEEFIERVTGAAETRASREYEILLARKRKDEPAAKEVHDWEKAFYEQRVRSEEFRLDSKKIRAYFPYLRVKEGILSLTEHLFGVRFRPAPDARRWHQDVEVLDVLEDGRKVGRVYLDMHPREGKFKHAAMFPILRGIQGKALPEAALVCNFPNPRTTSGPALLEHDDVLTFLHEFGHLTHQLFARDHQWARFSGAATEWDFIEVPSQLYEEWGWRYDVLRRFAVHHETGEPISEDLVRRMRRARDFGRALWVRHQMFYAALSLRCYGPDVMELDLTAAVRELQNRYSLFRFVEGTFFEASFGHLDDYSALYYTYMWSLVIEKDIFQEFKKRGTMSREVAAAYRDCILAPGGAKDAMDLVRAFLGRDYSFKAFEDWLDEKNNGQAKAS